MSDVNDPCDFINVEKSFTVTIKGYINRDFHKNTSEEDIDKELVRLVNEHFANQEENFTIDKIEF